MPAGEYQPLLRVCSLLNAAGARDLVIGGRACVLHGLIRSTEDVEIEIEPTEENAQRFLDALARMEDGAARELAPRELLDNGVVKIADDVEADVSTHAWKVTYPEAIGRALEVTLDGVRIPYLGLDDLIASKETYREADRADWLWLRGLKERQGQ
jgi:hypothetical protein